MRREGATLVSVTHIRTALHGSLAVLAPNDT